MATYLFHARPGEAGAVTVRIAGRLAYRLHMEVGRLLRALESEQTTGLWRQRPLLPNEHLFPDAYLDNAPSGAFREQHGDHMRRRLTEATRRVWAECAETENLALDHQGISDWFTVLGHAQTMQLRRRRWQRHASRRMTGAAEEMVTCLRDVQEVIAIAALGKRCPHCHPS